MYNIIIVGKVKRLIPLFIILILGAYLRFFMLASVPPSLTWDEASWGYNAYSLGINGKDEFGKFLPITYLESFGDYKPPVYAYLSAPFVKLLGLNEWAVRFPSALLGTFTILLTYLLTKKIFNTAPERKSEILGLLSAGILAISPWHILLSRAAFEANVATFFIVFGIYLFLASIEKRWLLPLSVVSFVVSMYTFNTARFFVPLIVIFLFLKFYKTLFFKMRPQTIFSFFLSFLIFLPLFLFLLTPSAKLRFQEVNIFSDSDVVINANQEVENDNNAFWSKILHNRRVGYSLSYVRHYFDNLSPEFLFIRGDGNPKFSIQDTGQMYIWEIPFFVLGILVLFRKREGHWLLIPVWILLGLIPAGVARETPHALRIETIIPTFQILTAYGLYHLISNFKFQISHLRQGFGGQANFKFKSFAVGLIIIAAAFNFLYFVHNYFIHYPREFSGEWQYGYKEAVKFTAENENKYDKIHITEALGRPYIYFLFYLQYPPSRFRENSTVFRDAAGFTHVAKISKYYFKDDLNKGVDEAKKNLFIGDPGKLPSKIKVLRQFKRLDGTTALVAYEKKIVYEKKSK